MTSLVEIPDIAKELKQLAKARAAAKQESAVLFNLVIYVQDEARLHYYRDIYKSVTERYPCRILFVHLDNKLKKDVFDVKVSQESHKESGKPIFSDLIDIHCSANHAECLPYLVTPHLVPDTPIYLLWGQDPTIPNPLLSQLAPYAKRLIFDSECSANLQNFSRKLLKEHKEDHTLGKIDLNWVATSGWRDVFASLFNSEERLKQLQRAHTINIFYNKTDGDHIQHGNIPPIYFQAWLSQTLGWKFIQKKMENQNETVHLTYHSGEGRVEVFLTAQLIPDEPIPGSITQIEINTHENEDFFLQRKDTEVTAHISTPDRCELPAIYRMLSFKRGYTFLKEVFYQPISDKYYEMLQSIEKIEWHK